MFICSVKTFVSRYVVVFIHIIAALDLRVGAILGTRPSCCAATSQLLTASRGSSVKQPMADCIFKRKKSCTAVNVICVIHALFSCCTSCPRYLLQVELKKLQHAERRRGICGPLRPTKMVSFHREKKRFFSCQLVNNL